jgi:hypothetical protein
MSPIDLWKETPLIFSDVLSNTLNASVYLKLEVRLVRIFKCCPDSYDNARISTHHILLSIVGSLVLSDKRRTSTVSHYTLSSRRAAMLV